MTILFVFENLELGGAERQGLLLAKYLGSHSQSVEVIGLKSQPGRLSELCEDYGIPWEGIQFIWPMRWFLAPLRIPELIKLAVLIRKKKPDVILSYTWLPNLACSLIWRYTGAKSYVWNQRDEGLGALSGGYWERVAVRRTPAFFANSIGGKTFLIKTYDIPSTKITLIRNGVLLPEPAFDRNRWRHMMGVDEHRFVACMVANLHKNKDHATLLKAWEIVARRAKESGECPPLLLLAGRLDEKTAELRSFASELGIEDDIRFLGSVEDVSGLFLASDVCVHSSLSEGLPNAVLEAMAAGLPVVGTDIPGIRDATGPDGKPYLSPVRNSKMMADHIWLFYKDKSIRIKIGSMMRNRVKEEFNWCISCSKTTQSILNLVE